MTNPPHETPFHYEDALVSSCASSPLARSLRSQGEPEEEDSSSGDVHRAPSQKPLRQQQQQHIRDANRDCQILFEQHAAHYHRPPLSADENQFWGAIVDDETLTTTDYGDHSYLETSSSPRIEAFLRSVIFVHEHNKMGKHTVALNRFSDMLPQELPLMSHGSSGSDASSSFGGADFEPLEAALDTALLPLDIPSFQGMKSTKERKPIFVPLDDDEKIETFGEKIRRRQQQQRHLSKNTLNIKSMRDSWWWLGGGHTHHGNNHHLEDQVDVPNPLSRHSSRTKPSKSKEDGGLELGDIAKSPGLEEKGDGSDDDDEGDAWGSYLNWATEDNPDGVSVVHPAMDQGMCGSCWAVSALGTLEASITRNMAYIAYEEALSSVTSASPHTSNSKPTDPIKFAVLAAQLIERQSITTADLSVQELVDCDTHYDQGCAGGNPLLAFYFLHRYGVTSSKNYPYTSFMDTCKYHKVDEPVATVETWGILTPDHENNMEKVLRFIGPVAVGMIGADPGFVMYQKGVFTSTKGGRCDVGQADHAMLITGYGEEVSKDGTVQKYWIARNSWGSGWGENGYVRMARLGGKKGHRGECGIARSPSVALGGMFTTDVELDNNDLYGSTRGGERVDKRSGSGHSDSSTISRASSQIRSGIHKIRTRLGFVQKGIVMSTINGSENRNAGIVVPYAITMGMLAACLLFTQLYRKRRRSRQQDGIQRNQSNEEESVATNWSTIGVYNGVHENIGHGSDSNVCIGSNDGERMHLLENSSGSLYT